MNGRRCRAWIAVAGGVLLSTAPVEGQPAADTPGPEQRTLSTVAGRPHAAALEALALLRASADDGLNPDAYDIASLTASLDAGPAANAATDLDARINQATAAYLRDLHRGRVDPRSIGLHLDVVDDHHDFAQLVRDAIGGNALADLVAAYRPAMPQYAALRQALRRYRGLTDPAKPLSAVGKSVHPGEAYADLRALAGRLVAFGDLTGDAPGTDRYETSDVYDVVLAEAVRRFQVRHGLAADGVLGKSTIAALNVPVAWRTRQIELALERLRWVPHLTRPRVLVLNIPMFQLWGWAPGVDREPSFSTNVIVGKALSPTPIMVKEMREVIFRPYWNIPRSILRNEVLPIVKRDPAYLQRQEMELVTGESDDAAVIEASAENLSRLERGQLRLRQRPGPRNALGLVKFVFPNEDNVYMHGTPAQALFSRSRRDFSHGCIRVQDPVGLAEWLLAGQTGWPRERILAAMAASRPEHVRLVTPIQVLLFYTTAAVLPDGTVRFADDIYKHDVRLDHALASGASSGLRRRR